MGVTKEETTDNCIEEFKKYGWKISKGHTLYYGNNESMDVDFALIGEIAENIDLEIKEEQEFPIEYYAKTEGICGYVLVLQPENKTDVLVIKEKLNILLTRVKPQVLFVTDGNVFEAYFNGVYYDTLMVPIKASNIAQNIRTLIYAQKLMELRKENK